MKYTTFFLLATLAAVQLSAQSLTISPATITRSAGQTQQFALSGPTALITNVTWTLDPASGAGTITSSGLYSAPSTIAAAVTVKVIATPVLDPTKRVEASVRLVPLALSITPATATLTVAQTRQFTASVTPSGSDVVWSLDPPGVGSVSPTGLYTAPSSITATRTVRIVAVSSVDGTKSDSATVTLNPLNLTVSPTRVTLNPAETRQFTAASSNGPATVTWSVDPAGRGTVSSTGLYTAPATVPVEVEARVIATSTVDNSRIAVATVVLRPLSLTIRPASDDLTITQTRQFTVTAPAGVDARVTWSLDPATGMGTISTAGLYTAPNSIPTAATVRVIATSVVDATRTVAATVRLNPLDISITPQRTTLTIGETKQFTASVPSGAPSQMTWSVDPAGRGTVSATGLYTAPSSIAAETTVQVIARSAVDNTRFAAATVTLTPLNLTVSPATVILRAGQTRQFNARVAGADANVTWRIDPATAGSISATGLYTAPATLSAESTVQVIATSRADTAVSASATVRLKPSDISVTPATVSLTVNETRQFTARVTGGGGVTWSLDPPGVGTVSTAGLYTAPTAIPAETTVRVIATGVTDPTDSAFGLVTLTPQDLSISPSSVTMTVDQTRQFTVRGPGNTNPAVTWSVEPSTGAGTVSSAGLYRAPLSIATATLARVVATLVSDTTKKLTATVTLEPLDLKVTPLTSQLRPGQTRQFSASAQAGAPDTVTWRIDPASAGSISAAGLYTAPATVASPLTVRVIATSTVDTARTAEATLTVRATDLDVTPLTISLRAGRTVQFQAKAVGGTLPAGGILWSIAPAVGSISAAGLYTAPAVVAAQQLVTVTATSAADPSVLGTATVTLQTCTGVCVTITPDTVTLNGGQTQQFAASISSTANQAVTWSIEPAGVGTISATGLYTAPATVDADQVVTVFATSVADPTRRDNAVVNLRAPIVTAPPYISGVAPAVGSPGQTLNVTITGANTTFTSSTQVSFGAGVRVGGAAAGAFGPVTLVNPTTITALVAIDGTAEQALKTLQVRTGASTLELIDAFFVEVPPLVISGVTPSIVLPGDTVTITAATLPAGTITAAAITVTLTPTTGAGTPVTTPAVSLGPDTAGARTITFVAPSTLAAGDYRVSISGSTSLRPIVTDAPALLAVNILPQITQIAPPSSRAGETAIVTLTVQDMVLTPGQVTASFGAGITVGSATNSADGQFGPLEVLTPVTARALITVNGTASLGVRTVKLKQGSVNIELANGYTVLQSLPIITFLEPAAGIFTNQSPVTVRGSVNTPVTSVIVNGVAAQVAGTTFQAVVPLVEGDNPITAVATTAAGLVGTKALSVNLDTTPPRVTLNSPAANPFTTTAASITLSGTINDLVIGTVNDQQATVNVNGSAVAVANRRFLAPDLPLVLGDNTFTITGRDRTGNSASTTLVVKRVTPLQPEIRLTSGNNQTGPINALLAQPLVVTLVDNAGTPQPGRDVVAKVVESDGSLDPAGAVSSFVNGGIVRSVVLKTDSRGQASFRWTLGSRAGAGNNRMEVSAPGFNGLVSFTATAQTTAPARLLLDGGANQSGAVGRQLPFPFTAVVTDAGLNRLSGIPVVFTVTRGGGNIDGQTTVTRLSDSDGLVQVSLTLGPQAGASNNTVAASLAAAPVGSKPLYFSATGLAVGAPADTKISGVVQDNSNQPIPGVTMRLFQPYLATSNNVPVPAAPPVVTDARGQFVISSAPIGRFKLMADGGTATRPGRWPTLEYDVVTVSGANNTVGMPIFLPSLDTVNQLCVSETTGGTLTLPQVPGFSLTVQPGSATFPGGARTGCLSVTPVHHDKVPMVPSFGNQPRFIVTIQPVGAHFNPPAAVTMPNTDSWRPGQTVEMYSFDHDLSNFVAVGQGTVTEDGRIVRSNPGVGVLKAGWFGGGQPPPDADVEPVSLAVTPSPTVLQEGESATVTLTGSPDQSGQFSFNIAQSSIAAAQLLSQTGNVAQVKVSGQAQGQTRLDAQFTVESQTANGGTEVIVAKVFLKELRLGGTGWQPTYKQATDWQSGQLSADDSALSTPINNIVYRANDEGVREFADPAAYLANSDVPATFVELRSQPAVNAPATLRLTPQGRPPVEIPISFSGGIARIYQAELGVITQTGAAIENQLTSLTFEVKFQDTFKTIQNLDQRIFTLLGPPRSGNGRVGAKRLDYFTTTFRGRSTRPALAEAVGGNVEPRLQFGGASISDVAGNPWAAYFNGVGLGWDCISGAIVAGAILNNLGVEAYATTSYPTSDFDAVLREFRDFTLGSPPQTISAVLQFTAGDPNQFEGYVFLGPEASATSAMTIFPLITNIRAASNPQLNSMSPRHRLAFAVIRDSLARFGAPQQWYRRPAVSTAVSRSLITELPPVPLPR